MTDKSNRTRHDVLQQIPIESNPAELGQPKAYSMTVNQINAARRRNALKQVRELIREHGFTMEEIGRIYG